MENFGNTSSTKCPNGHRWFWVGSPDMNTEGFPCECGEVLYHTEICPTCKQPHLQPIPNPNHSK